MPSFNKTDHAFNRKSDCILYHFDNGEIIKITKEFYLRLSPDNTEEKWYELKEESDRLFEEEMKQDTQQTKTKHKEYRRKQKDKSTELPPTFEELLIEDDEKEAIRLVSKQLLKKGKLTKIQKRRFTLYYIEGFSYRKIAEMESVHFTSIQESILSCRKKLRKFYEES